MNVFINNNTKNIIYSLLALGVLRFLFCYYKKKVIGTYFVFKLYRMLWVLTLFVTSSFLKLYITEASKGF